MFDFIKAIRTQHTVIVTFCAVTMLFFIDPDKNGRYSAAGAEKELIALDSLLSADGHLAYIHGYMRDYHDIDFEVQPYDSLNVHMDLRNLHVSNIILTSEVPKSDWKIGRLREFENHSGEVIARYPIVSNKTLIKAVSRFKGKDWLNEDLDTIKVMSVAVASTPEIFGIEAMHTDDNFELKAQIVPNISESNPLQTFNTDISIYVEALGIGDREMATIYREGDVALPIPIETTRTHWFRGSTVKDVVYTQYGEFLKNTLAICPECDDMVVSSAISHVRRSDQQTQRKVKALGLEINESTVKAVVPITIMILLAYLRIMLGNLHHVSVNQKLNADFFPWFGVVNNRTSSFASILSIIVFPTATMLMACWRAFNSYDFVGLIYLFISMLIVLFLGVMCVVKARSIAKLLDKRVEGW